MPPYGSLHSPSLRKMEQSRPQYGRKRISMGNLIGDPFALATISIATVSIGLLCASSPSTMRDVLTFVQLQLAWIIAFVANIIAHIQDAELFPVYNYWTLVFYPFLILGIFLVIASDSIQTYHVALVGYLAVGLVSATAAANAVIYSPSGAKEASGAGFILLCMVTVRASPCWADGGCITL